MEYLKIKDGVDLTELANFGFKFCPQDNWWELKSSMTDSCDSVWLTVDRNGIDIYLGGENYLDCIPQDILCKLHDLIKAEIVEKVVEHD